MSRMIDESKVLKERCQWYTSMLGKYSSVEIVVGNLRGAGVDNWAVKDLVQGNKTRRWAVAWSWGDMRPSNVSVSFYCECVLVGHLMGTTKEVARGTSTLPKHLLPFPSDFLFTVETSVERCSHRLNDTLQALDLQWQYRPIMATGVGFAKGNVWSRAARRKQQQSPNDSSCNDPTMNEGEDGEPALGFKIRLNGHGGGAEVMVRWLQGRDSVLFESFCGMLKRQLSAP